IPGIAPRPSDDAGFAEICDRLTEGDTMSIIYAERVAHLPMSDGVPAITKVDVAMETADDIMQALLKRLNEDGRHLPSRERSELETALTADTKSSSPPLLDPSP